jgi:hypothetical protein
MMLSVQIYACDTQAKLVVKSCCTSTYRTQHPVPIVAFGFETTEFLHKFCVCRFMQNSVNDITKSRKETRKSTMVWHLYRRGGQTNQSVDLSISNLNLQSTKSRASCSTILHPTIQCTPCLIQQEKLSSYIV